MGTSIHKGLPALNAPISTLAGTSPSSGMQVLMGHVLDVSYIDPVPGAIKVKIIGLDRKSDDETTRVAFPADLNMVKYPIPGELVVMFNGIGGNTIKDVFGTQLYYISTITTNNSITFNSNPFFSSSETEKTAYKLLNREHEMRFEKKIINMSAYKPKSSGLFALPSPVVKERGKVTPVEGDFILQGRFGSSIRIGSSGNPKTGVGWKVNKDKTGDPIIVFSVHDSEVTELSRVEDVNLEDSSIYVCSSQVIPVEMSVSELRSCGKVYDTYATSSVLDPLPFLGTPELEFSRIEFSNLEGSENYKGPPIDIAALGLTGAVPLCYKLLLEREGTSLVPGWDINNWRIGHGSSTITLENGIIVKLPDNPTLWPNKWIDRQKGILGFTNIGNSVQVNGQDHHDSTRKLWKGYMHKPIPFFLKKEEEKVAIITREDAGRDLSRRIGSEFLPGVLKAIKSFGGTDQAIQNLGFGALAALVSIKYNYGNVHARKTWGNLSPAAVAAKGDKVMLANYIRQIPHGSPKRHAREAEYAEGSVTL